MNSRYWLEMPSTYTKALVLSNSISDQEKFSKQFELVHDFECPNLDEHSVLVSVQACTLRDERRKYLKNWKLLSDVSVGREVCGKITEVGKSVTRFNVGDAVVGIIPLDVKTSGCAKFCVLSQYDAVLRPSNVKPKDAVYILKDAIKAYTAVYYLGKIQSGDTVLLFNADSDFGFLISQLAKYVGAKVIAAVDNDRGLNLLRTQKAVTVIDTRLKKKSLVDYCMEESGGLGIDCVIDNGVDMYSNRVDNDDNGDLISFDDSCLGSLPSKHDIISTLSVGGRWVTSQNDLQLDPPDSELLFFKSASLHFLFEDSWTLSRNMQGKYLHILEDIIKKLSEGTLSLVESAVVNFDDCPKALECIDMSKEQKIVVEVS